MLEGLYAAPRHSPFWLPEQRSGIIVLCMWVGGGVDKGKEHMRKGVSGLLFEKRQEKYTVCLGSRVPALFKTCIS